MYQAARYFVQSAVAAKNQHCIGLVIGVEFVAPKYVYARQFKRPDDVFLHEWGQHGDRAHCERVAQEVENFKTASECELVEPSSSRAKHCDGSHDLSLRRSIPANVNAPVPNKASEEGSGTIPLTLQVPGSWTQPSDRMSAFVIAPVS